MNFFTRRQALAALGAGLAFVLLPRRSLAAALATAMKESDLIYLTPIKSNGNESRCQSEIWFVADGADMVICTATKSWRTRAVKAGLTRARIWVGDLGTWKDTDGKYKSLPMVEARASVISDKDEQSRILELYGDKYTMEWILWGRRFRNGLEDGSRTMIRYTPA